MFDYLLFFPILEDLEEDFEEIIDDLLELFSASYSSIIPTSCFKKSAFLSFLVSILCIPINEVLTGLDIVWDPGILSYSFPLFLSFKASGL